MKIAVWHNLLSGGGKRALYDQVRGLAAKGHAITVWCPSTAETEYLSLGSIVREEILPLARPVDLPAPLEWLMRLARANAQTVRDIKSMMSHAALFAGLVNRGGFDVVFANPCHMFFTPFAARYLTVPCVLYLQEPCRRLFEASPRLPWLAEEDSPYQWWHPLSVRHWLGDAARVYPVRLQAREESTNIRAFDRVLVNSRFSRESVLRAHGVDATVCYLGIDAGRFAHNDGPRDHFALSVGEFIESKNPQFVIRAVAASRSRPALVWIANRVDERYLEESHDLAVRLGVRLDVHIGVNEDELVRCYRRASVFLYAPRLEPFGLAPLEANACGTPVIAVAEGGVRETVAHMETGLIVEEEPARMGEAIDHLMDNASVAQEMGREGARRVRDIWTLEAATTRLERHLIAVAGGHKQRD